MGKVVVSPEALAKSAAKYRREILMMPVFALGEFLQHVSLRTGIRYSETVGEMSDTPKYSQTPLRNKLLEKYGVEVKSGFVKSIV